MRPRALAAAALLPLLGACTTLRGVPLPIAPKKKPAEKPKEQTITYHRKLTDGRTPAWNTKKKSTTTPQPLETFSGLQSCASLRRKEGNGCAARQCTKLICTVPRDDAELFAARRCTCHADRQELEDKAPAHALDLQRMLETSDGSESAVEALRRRRLALPKDHSNFNADELINYQEAVFKAFDRLPTKGTLADQHFLRQWKREYRTLVPQVGAVFIPVIWRPLTDDYPWRSERGGRWRRELIKAWANLDHCQTHFVVMMQASLAQLGAAFKVMNRSIPMLDFTNVVVFDSRGGDVVPAFPVPLISETTLERGNATRAVPVSFHGRCTDGGRTRGRGVRVSLPNIFKNFKGAKVGDCKAMLTQQMYRSELRQSAFALAPAGSFPTSFRQFEAVQAGAVPVVVGRTEVTQSSLWLPFQDIGADWAKMSVLASDQRVKSLPGEITNLMRNGGLESRQKHALNMSSLFTPQGVYEYVVYIMAFYAGKGAPEATRNACLANVMARRGA
mmetsp:Transcript_100684/g.285315  ORF Transcript_100684/g.285315 Transcript_100684/m.285315 type:complete len:504 (-) Transcript_100684:33-1544(-)